MYDILICMYTAKVEAMLATNEPSFCRAGHWCYKKEMYKNPPCWHKVQNYQLKSRNNK